MRHRGPVVKCRKCGALVSTYKPARGTGSQWYPYRHHDDDGMMCLGGSVLHTAVDKPQPPIAAGAV